LGRTKDLETENIWKFTHKFIELDTRKKAGNELDEFWSHKFLESLGETLTVIQLREKLRKIDLDANGKMALLEYLCFKYQKTIPMVINAPQGENKEEVEKAQKELREIEEALNFVQKKLAEQQNKLMEQKRTEEELRKAEQEQLVAVKELHSQEEAFNKQIEILTQKSESGDSLVSKNKAKQELAQLKQENPLPLRKAKITQEAALRKVEKQRKDAEVARKEVEESTRKVEEAVRQTEVKMQEAQDFLEEVKRKGGVAGGAIWWMERELIEAKKYLPRSKQ